MKTGAEVFYKINAIFIGGVGEFSKNIYQLQGVEGIWREQKKLPP